MPRLHPREQSAPALRRLIAAGMGLLALGMACAWLILSQPWLGLQLEAHGEALIVVDANGPSKGAIPKGVTLVSIQGLDSPVPAVALRGYDIVEEPDQVETYEELDGFIQRQGDIHGHLSSPKVALTWRSASGEVASAVIEPGARRVSSLGFRFWFPLLVSSLACLIAVWIWALRPKDPAAQMFAWTGFWLPWSALSAAVYGSRELALPTNLFAVLKFTNHGSAAFWGAGLVALFLVYPREQPGRRWLWLPFALFGLWWVADAARWAPDLNWGIRLLLLTELLAAIGLAVWQWRRSAGQARERAALKWLNTTLLLGSTLFTLTIIVTVILGWLPPLSQAASFGFFLLIYFGIAVGLGRYHLFDLDAWAYRILLALAGMVMVLGLDAALISVLDWSDAWALGFSLWTVGLIYLPLREWVWRRWIQGRSPPLETLFPDLVHIAFEPQAEVRAQRWGQLLDQLFHPAQRLSVDPSAVDAVAQASAHVFDDGEVLTVPACADVPGWILKHRQQGQALFTRSDAQLVNALRRLMNEAHRSHLAHEAGAAAERQRITQDIHDDVGARLLMLIHRSPSAELAELARAAMNDLRSAVAALEAKDIRPSAALADWRAEASQRCEAASVQLHWQVQPPVAQWDDLRWRPHQRLLMERAVREGLTNALKHGQAEAIWISLSLEGSELRLDLANDQQDASKQIGPMTEGRGLRGMRQRLQAEGGDIDLMPRQGGGMVLRLRLPLGEQAVWR
jgi:signal transduction histidine kinase